MTDTTKLVRDCEALVNNIARRHRSYGITSTDDLVQEGFIGLLQANKKFNQECRIKFKTYAAHRINGQILDHLRSTDYLSRLHREEIADGTKQPIKIISIHERSPHSGRTVTDTHETSDNNHDLVDLRDYLDKLLKCLKDRDRTIIDAYFLNNKTARQISKTLDCTESYVHQRIKAALKSLRIYANRLQYD